MIIIFEFSLMFQKKYWCFFDYQTSQSKATCFTLFIYDRFFSEIPGIPSCNSSTLQLSWSIECSQFVTFFTSSFHQMLDLRGTIFKKGVKIGNKSKTCTSPLHILLRDAVQILLFWNTSVDVSAFISCWEKLFQETSVTKCFRISMKKNA